jgi:hypothetical protein
MTIHVYVYIYMNMYAVGEYVYNIECHKSYRIIPYYPLDGCTPLKLPTQTTKGDTTSHYNTHFIVYYMYLCLSISAY